MLKNDSLKVAAIIRDSGGTVVGRTRLQKIAYLLSETGLEDGFHFVYKHYGPFSESLASAARLGSFLDDFKVTEKPTSWGGTYSIYSVDPEIENVPDSARQSLAHLAACADAIELELAATAIFLFKEGFEDPWVETARRKPEKTRNGQLDRAKDLLCRLCAVQTPHPLPDFN